ncbi:DUF692 domain-containing protein [Veronia pacifica]|uniref:MNIO family bufferin maturase n=1 Tax=Veronia pacifica TaxID=1080227 RepID=UPI001112D4BE
MSIENQVGVGLRRQHHDYFQQNRPDIGWLEIHSENYFRPGSVSHTTLMSLREQYPISCHGVGLSLGSVDQLNPAHLAQLKTLVDAVNPILVSEHLSWSSVDGQYFNDLLPLPYTEEALDVFCRNVSQTQDYLGRQLLVENPSSYLSFSHSTMPEWEFLVEVQRRTQCGLLLDLNNIHVSAFNHGFDSKAYLEAIDPTTVQEIHLAGYTVSSTDSGEIWIDTHSRPVSEPVWHLYHYWVAKHGMCKTLIEWDADLPEPDVLLNEAQKARDIASEALTSSQVESAS